MEAEIEVVKFSVADIITTSNNPVPEATDPTLEATDPTQEPIFPSDPDDGPMLQIWG